MSYLKPSVKKEGESFAHFRFHRIKLPSSCFEEVKCLRRRFKLKEIFLQPLVAASRKKGTKPKIFFDELLSSKEFFYPTLDPDAKHEFRVQGEALFARYKGCHTGSNFDQFVGYFDFEKNFSTF